MINLVVIDDQNSMVNTLRFLIEAIPNMFLVGCASNGQDAIKIVEEHQPDVVLMDISMPVMNGIDATKIITQRFSKTKVILLTGYDNQQFRHLAIKAGADGYVSKLTDLDNINLAIDLVAAGYEFYNFEQILGTEYQSEIVNSNSSQE
ncbi:MAG: response regulator transcription factor [Cyanobacteria bacterium P01_C01_bin.72]